MVDVPNYKTGVGRLVTDRFDFEHHVEGSAFRHPATAIDVGAPLDGYGITNVQEGLVYLVAHLSVPIIPDATTLSKGVIQLSGDLGGTAATPTVISLRGYPISNTPPTISGQVLTWNGSAWIPQSVSAAFTFLGDVNGTASATTVVALQGRPVDTTTPNAADVLTWGGSSWGPAAIGGATLNYAGGPAWADGTTNPATTISGQLTKIISDLAATTGDVKIGSPLRAGSPTSLSAGSVGTQIASLLTALNTFQSQKGAASGLASLDGTANVPNAQLLLAVANGIATLDISGKVFSAQLNLAVPSGIATLNGSSKLVDTQRAGWFVTDGYVSSDSYASILTTYSTNSFTDDSVLTLLLPNLQINDTVVISISAGVSSAAVAGGEFQVVANSNAGGFTEVPGTLMHTFNTGSNNPANPVDRWAAVSRYIVNDNGNVIVKVQGRTITGAGDSYTNGSACLYCTVYRP